jgi:anti-sigma factor RsiW
MKEDLKFQLQAYLDGELPSGEIKAVRDLLAADAAARDLFAELTNTRAALAAHESTIKLPETREFYWSKIQRQIEREEKVIPVANPSPFFVWLRRSLASAVAVAAVFLGVMLVQQQMLTPAYVADSSFADSETFTYRDYDSGTTLVWLTYPAENEFAEGTLDDTMDLN